MKAIITAAFLVAYSSLEAVIFHEIDTTVPLECSFSLTQHNRIALDGGRLSKVICSEGLFSFRMENDSGQAFVTVAGPIGAKGLMSVITDGGTVQDLLITVEDRPSEVVILRESAPANLDLVVSADQKDSVVDLVRGITAGRIPAGYVPRDLQESESRYVKGLKWHLIPTLVLDGPQDRITVYQLKNGSHKSVSLTEDMIRAPDDQWVYIEDLSLAAKTKTTVIVASKR